MNDAKSYLDAFSSQMDSTGSPRVDLRAYLAGQMIQALLFDRPNLTPETAASQAVSYADALIKELQK